MAWVQPSVELPALAELAALKRWVLWKTVARHNKPTKSPITTGGGGASSTNPKTWTTFENVCAYMAAGTALCDGIGFVFVKSEDGSPSIIGIDLDKCRDPETGIIDQWAAEIIGRFNSYTEVSPSGRGLHIYVKGVLPEDGGRRGHVECYAAGRYFTVTGEHLEGTPDEIVDASDQLSEFWWRFLRPDSLPTGDQQSGHNGKPRLVVDNTEFPLKKHEALLDNDPTYAATWKRQRPGLHDQSLSSYDMALAVRAAMVSWTANEIGSLIREFRNKHGELSKADRPDYIERTVNRAISWVQQGNDDKRLGDLKESEAREEVQTDDDNAKRAIAMRLGVSVEKLIQVGSDPAAYFLVLLDGREIRIGDVDVLLSQAKFHGKIVAAAGIIPRRVKPAQWETVLEALMTLREVREAETINFAAQMAELMDSYLADRKPIDIDRLDGTRNKGDVVKARQPYIEGGQLHVSSQDATLVLATQPSAPEQAQIRAYLSMRGFRRVTVGSPGSTRSYWAGAYDPPPREQG